MITRALYVDVKQRRQRVREVIIYWIWIMSSMNLDEPP